MLQTKLEKMTMMIFACEAFWMRNKKHLKQQEKKKKVGWMMKMMAEHKEVLRALVK